MSDLGRLSDIVDTVLEAGSDDTFSFRWGIPLLDSGHTDIPNFMLDNYARAGVSRSEFLTIVHLARYQYESGEAECRPSVATVARQMGCSERTVQRTLAGLEARNLLVRHYRSGDTTIYDFTGFSRAMLGEAVDNLPKIGGDIRVTPDTSVTPTPDTGVTPGVTLVSPEEEKLRRKAEEEKKETAAGPPPIAFCSIHNTPMELREKDGDKWYSHRLLDGSWCKGAPGDQPGSEDPHVEQRQRYQEWGLVEGETQGERRRDSEGKYAAYIQT